jgi:hypothetical protein
MSQLAVTIGFPHDQAKPPVVLTGPEIPLLRQRQQLKEAGAKRDHPTFAKVELWSSSGGLVKRKKFLKPGALTVATGAPKAPVEPPKAAPKSPAPVPAKSTPIKSSKPAAPTKVADEKAATSNPKTS